MQVNFCMPFRHLCTQLLAIPRSWPNGYPLRRNFDKCWIRSRVCFRFCVAAKALCDCNLPVAFPIPYTIASGDHTGRDRVRDTTTSLLFPWLSSRHHHKFTSIYYSAVSAGVRYIPAASFALWARIRLNPTDRSWMLVCVCVRICTFVRCSASWWRPKVADRTKIYGDCMLNVQIPSSLWLSLWALQVDS